MSVLSGLLMAWLPPLALIALVDTGLYFLGAWLGWSTGTTILLMVAVAVLVLGLLGLRVLLRARRRRRVQAQLDASVAGAALVGTPAAPAPLDERVRALLAAWRRAGDPGVGRRPWFLVLGDAGSGRRSLFASLGGKLREAGEDFPAGAAGREADIWRGGGAVFVVPRDDAALASLLPVLRQRLHDGIAGVLLTVDLGGLLDHGEDEVAAGAHDLRERVDRLCARLGEVLPVHLVLTRADQLHGFVDYVDHLDKTARTRPLGLVLDYRRRSLDELLGELDERYATLYARICALRRGALASVAERPAAERLIGFPTQFLAVKPRLSLFVREFAGIRPQHESGLLRGCWFTSARQEGTTRDRALSVWDPDLGLAQDPQPVAVADQRGYFTDELLERGFAADAARPYARSADAARQVRRFRLAAAATALVAAILVAGCCVSFVANGNLVGRLQNVVVGLVRSDTGTVPVPRSLGALDPLLAEMEQLEAWQRLGHPVELDWGLYQGDTVYAGLRRIWYGEIARLALHDVVEALVTDLGADLAAARSGGGLGVVEQLFDRYYALANLLGRQPITGPQDEQRLGDILGGRRGGVPYWLDALDLDPGDSAAVARAERSLAYFISQGRRWQEWALSGALDDTTRRIEQDARGFLLGGEEWIRLSFTSLGRDIAEVQDSDLTRREQILATGPEQAIFALDEQVRPRRFYTQAAYDQTLRGLIVQRAVRIHDRMVLLAAAGGGEAPPLAEVEGRFLDRYAKDWVATWDRVLQGLAVQPMADIPTALQRLDAITAEDGVYDAVLDRIATAQALADGGWGTTRNSAGFNGGTWRTGAYEALGTFRQVLQTYRSSTGAGRRLRRIDDYQLVADGAKTALAAIDQAVMGLADADERQAIRGHLEGLLRAAMGAVGNELLAEAESRWRSEVVAGFTGLATRFPFDAQAEASVGIADFDAFFAPSGALARVVAVLQTMAAVDNGLGGPAVSFGGAYDTFIRDAARLWELLGNGTDGKQERVLPLRLGLVQFAGVEDLRFSIDQGGSVGVFDDPSGTGELVWPFRDDLGCRFRIRVERGRWLDVDRTVNDPWGPLRIFAGGRVVNETAPVRFAWTVSGGPASAPAPAPAPVATGSPTLMIAPVSVHAVDTAIAPEVRGAEPERLPKLRGGSMPTPASPAAPVVAAPPSAAMTDAKEPKPVAVGVEQVGMVPIAREAYAVGLSVTAAGVAPGFFTLRWFQGLRPPDSLR